MNLGIVGIAFNGYGRFLPRWCKFISRLQTPPQAVTVVLGAKHGLTTEMRSRCLMYLPDLKIIESEFPPVMGTLRNEAIEHTKTTWIMYLSIDDKILPWAIDEFKKYQKKADYICIKWLTKGLGKPLQLHSSPLPKDMALKHRGKGFVVGHSPFRRKFWQTNPYPDHDYPNYPFLAQMVEAGARFMQTKRPCTVYLRWAGSHARTVLQGRNRNKAEKAKAVYYKKDLERRLKNYYEATNK